MNRSSGSGMLRLLVIGVAFALLASACSSDGETETAEQTDAQAEASTATTEAATDDTSTDAGAGDSGTESEESGGEMASSPVEGECGYVPLGAANDPAGLLAALPAEVAADYDLYPYEIKEPALADFASDKSDGYTAAIVGMPPASPFIATMTDSIRRNLESEGFEIVADLAPDEASNVPLQLQQFNEALSLSPDIIFYQPAAPEPSIELAQAAYEAGVVLVAVMVPIDSEYSVSVTRNVPLAAARVTSGVVQAIDGEGSVLRVGGVPGIPNTTWSDDGINAVLANCPDVETAGEVVGFFQPAVAQTEVLKFLATSPTGVDAVLQSGAMDQGIFNAFEQSGLETPVIGADGTSRGFATWASQNPDYPYFGTLTHAAETGEVAVEIGVRILGGEGPIVNQIIQADELIEQADLADLVDPAWDIGDGSDFEGPDEGFLASDRLDLFFANPSN